MTKLKSDEISSQQMSACRFLSACHLCSNWPDGRHQSWMIFLWTFFMNIWIPPIDQKMCFTLQTFGLLVTIASLSTATFGTQKHHKVRHKHNMHHLQGNHVNKIREAFDEYRHVVHKNNLREIPEIADISLSDYDDAIGDDFKRASWATHKNDALRVAPIAEPSKINKNFVDKLRAKPSSEVFVRHKRVHVSTTSTTTPRTTKSIDNYDDEYDDDDNYTANRRLNDDAQTGLVRLNRDVS